MVLAVWYEPDHVKYAVYTSDHNLERKSPHIMDQRLLVAEWDRELSEITVKAELENPGRGEGSEGHLTLEQLSLGCGRRGARGTSGTDAWEWAPGKSDKMTMKHPDHRAQSDLGLNARTQSSASNAETRHASVWGTRNTDDISAPGPQALGLNDPASRGSSRWTVGSRQPGSPRVGQRPPECGLASSCAGGAARPGQVHPRKARQPQGLALQSTRRLSHLSPCWVSGEPPELAVEQLRPT
uniref:Uncharacterized protein n=1 Tax=Rangifer tarandus platyrhynchus TaxID=3082113 RepID=A0ACB0FL75_RANTA|nr:unnamed protein product [Rangifer tarandus platyrhynchus]